MFYALVPEWQMNSQLCKLVMETSPYFEIRLSIPRVLFDVYASGTCSYISYRCTHLLLASPYFMHKHCRYINALNLISACIANIRTLPGIFCKTTFTISDHQIFMFARWNIIKKSVFRIQERFDNLLFIFPCLKKFIFSCWLNLLAVCYNKLITMKIIKTFVSL